MIRMSDYIDETSLTDEEVAAAIAEAKAKKAARSRNLLEKTPEDQNKTLDTEDSNALIDASSSAAKLEAEEDESPAVRSAKSFSNAFAAAKKKREADLLKKKEERQAEAEEKEEEESEEEEKENEVAAAAVIDEDDGEDAQFDTDSEDDDEEYEDDYEDDEDEDDSEYDYEDDDEDDDEDDEEEDGEDDEDDGDFDSDGIFETDDENGEYNTTVPVDEDEDEYDDDEEDADEDEDESTFSTKTKVIIGIIIAVLVIAIIAAFAFFMKGSGSDKNTSSTVSVVDGEVTSVKFAEPSVSLQVGETKALKIVVEPADAKDKTFKLKSNDESIVKVNEQGQITGISSGSTTVTATLKSNPTMTASLVVNVIDEEQSTLNVFNRFVNSILDGTTDIDSDEETDTTEDENLDEQEDTESDSDSDTDSEAPKKATHKLTGNKIDDFDSDGELELALYYEPNTDNEEPLVRVFRYTDASAAETETDSEEEELLYDEFGNPIESSDTDSETDSEPAADSEKDKASAGEKAIVEVEPYSEAYMTIHSALEADSAATPWNTSYLEVKESEQVTARVRILSSGYEAPTYTYESEDEEIATVDKQGNIKGVKPGTVFITVSSPLNSDAVAKVKVRVKDDTDLLDDYLANIPVVNNTNDAVFPTETLTGKAIVDIDNDGVSELLLRFRYSDNVEAINVIKVENEKCVCYKTYHNLSDLYEYNDGDGSYSNSILIHYTTGRVCMEYKATVAKSGSKSRTSEEKILTIESGGSLNEIVNFRTTTDISTKTVTSEVTGTTSRVTSSYDDEEDTDSETYYGEDTDSEEDTTSHIDEDNDGWDDITGEYFGSYAAFEFDEIAENGIDMTNKKPVKVLPQITGAPDDEEEEDYDYNDNDDDDYEEEETTSTVTTEVTEETTKYFVNGTPVDRNVYEETLTRYSATYSVWNAWESVY